MFFFFLFFFKNCAFCHAGLLGKPRQKRSFFNVLDRKEYFLEQRSEVSKTSEKSNFSKGLVHLFSQKIEFFTSRVFLGNPRQKILFFNILDRKKILFRPEK